MVLDTSLLNTQHYKVRIKGKVEQSMEKSSTLLYMETWGHPRLRSPTLLIISSSSSIILSEFFTPVLADGLSLEFLSETLLSILANLYNAVVWMDSTCPLIFKSSNSYINPLVTVPKVPITIGITVIFIFHIFFLFSNKF